MRILAAQINTVVGDLKGNTKKIIESIETGRRKKADIVLFPELTLSGYPPEDFLLLPSFMEAVASHLNEIIKASKGIVVVVGVPRQNPNSAEKFLYNSAAVIQNGKLLGFQDKILLPTYDVFDERRYFEPGNKTAVWDLFGCKVAITICEDLWRHSGLVRSTCYLRDPVLELKEFQPDLLLNLSASPYSVNKCEMRIQVSLEAAKTLQCPVLLCNSVGGNDSLIFDGGSVYVGPNGIAERAKSFIADEMLVDLNEKWDAPAFERDVVEDLYQALVLGVRDYFQKLGFQKACLGLSGGIDSALVACIAVDALGPDNVLALAMPSRYSSPESLRDAKILAKNLGIRLEEISIEKPFQSFLDELTPYFEGRENDVTEENLQARVRGMLLMAFSNKFGCIVLSTGNKSELALGYSTLYGDMCGGLAVIGDVTKRQVYALACRINRNSEVIPSYVIERPPSAELRPDQRDSDSLPDYDMIDDVLQSYLEDHMSSKEISEKFRYPPKIVEGLIKRIHQNEYKRRQSPPSLRVSEKAFSVGRRFPIVQKWI
jgi:NAD+ synthase (glutamine-hydrolysing)